MPRMAGVARSGSGERACESGMPAMVRRWSSYMAAFLRRLPSMPLWAR